MKKKLEINIKKIMVMYLFGFTAAQLLPNRFYFKFMNFYHMKLMDNLEVEEHSDFYKLN